MGSNALKNHYRRVDLVELFLILEKLAKAEFLHIADLCHETGLSSATIKRRVSDIRRLGIEVSFDRLNGGYKIHSWGPLVRPDGVTTGVWRKLLTVSSETANQ